MLVDKFACAAEFLQINFDSEKVQCKHTVCRRDYFHAFCYFSESICIYRKKKMGTKFPLQYIHQIAEKLSENLKENSSDIYSSSFSPERIRIKLQ